MIKKDGRLLDGTTINDAIVTSDNYMKIRPLCYMINCVHPKVLNSALSQNYNETCVVEERFRGMQVNTSQLSPEDLDNCVELKTSK